MTSVTGRLRSASVRADADECYPSKSCFIYTSEAVPSTRSRTLPVDSTIGVRMAQPKAHLFTEYCLIQ